MRESVGSSAVLSFWGSSASPSDFPFTSAASLEEEAETLADPLDPEDRADEDRTPVLEVEFLDPGPVWDEDLDWESLVAIMKFELCAVSFPQREMDRYKASETSCWISVGSVRFPPACFFAALKMASAFSRPQPIDPSMSDG